jgi:hypothetical protein
MILSTKTSQPKGSDMTTTVDTTPVADPADGPQELPATMTGPQKRAYRFGWKASFSGKDLEEAETNWMSHPQYNNWLDGYLDGASRYFGHLPNCAAHDLCG